MNNDLIRERQLIGRVGLGMLITGLLATPLLLEWSLSSVFDLHRTPGAAGIPFVFGGIAELMALVFGLIGWRSVCGKVAAYGAIVAFLLLGALAYYLHAPIEVWPGR